MSTYLALFLEISQYLPSTVFKIENAVMEVAGWISQQLQFVIQRNQVRLLFVLFVLYTLGILNK